MTFRAVFLALTLLLFACSKGEEKQQLLHVSYDPTREFYSAYNDWFIKQWKEKTGKEIAIRQAHGGSSSQARAVIGGLKADVLSLAIALDIDEVAKQTDLLPPNWQQRLPNHSAPYTSLVVFLVRKGNPKKIVDWGDLIRPGVTVITPNPKTSGGARWNYLAAYGYALNKYNGDKEKAQTYLKTLYEQVPLLDTASRAAATTFTRRGMGDVLITWENEAFLVQKELKNEGFEIVIPSLSILAEPPVTWVDKVIDADGNRALAEAYVQGLYAPEAQELAAQHFLRPIQPEILARYRALFPEVKTLSIEDFGGWQAVQKEHFSDGGLFEQIYLRSS